MITAAAIIMVFVFGSLALGPMIAIKEMGIGLAVAMFLDATVVRLVLVPSTMELLGDRNWWLPGWLDRILPRIHAEAPTTTWSPTAALHNPSARGMGRAPEVAHVGRRSRGVGVAW